MNNFVKTVLVLVSSFAVSAMALNDRDQAIADRLAPVGKVCVAGEDCGAAAATTVAASAAKSPEDIYNASCFSCHGTGAAGAPKLGDSSAWADRIAKGTETLYESAIKGFNGMPAKGLCFTCSDADLQGVVDYMVEKAN